MQYASTSAAVVGSGRIFLLAASNSHHLMVLMPIFMAKVKLMVLAVTKTSILKIFSILMKLMKMKSTETSTMIRVIVIHTYLSLCMYVCMYVCMYMYI